MCGLCAVCTYSSHTARGDLPCALISGDVRLRVSPIPQLLYTVQPRADDTTLPKPMLYIASVYSTSQRLYSVALRA
jgi:hypothetical protein